MFQMIVNIISSATKWLNKEFDNTLFRMSAQESKLLFRDKKKIDVRPLLSAMIITVDEKDTVLCQVA
jgi:hypothetical protein